jgi:hypothetical protein
VPAMEKQNRCIEFRQSPNRENHHHCHKSGKFGAFVVGPQYDFRDPHRNQHGCWHLAATPSVCRIVDRNSRSNAGGRH